MPHAHAHAVEQYMLWGAVSAQRDRRHDGYAAHTGLHWSAAIAVHVPRHALFNCHSPEYYFTSVGVN